MGDRGPIPKRDAQRRRRNKKDTPTTTAEGARNVEQPKANGNWHPTAKRMFDSLGESGQSKWYQPSDWAVAYLLCESISAEMRTKEPIKGATMAAWRAYMAGLNMLEGDRRRVQIELESSAAESGGEAEGNVTDISAWQSRIDGTG